MKNKFSTTKANKSFALKKNTSNIEYPKLQTSPTSALLEKDVESYGFGWKLLIQLESLFISKHNKEKKNLRDSDHTN